MTLCINTDLTGQYAILILQIEDFLINECSSYFNNSIYIIYLTDFALLIT